MDDTQGQSKFGIGKVLFLCYVVICSAILMVKDQAWRGEDISVFYAVFASVSFLVIGTSVCFFAGLLGGWCLSILSKTEWFMTNDRSLRGIFRDIASVAVGLAIAGSVLWLFKDVKVSHDPYEDEQLSDPFPK
jgi:hypothetical protein